jgi:hypothetical protein
MKTSLAIVLAAAVAGAMLVSGATVSLMALLRHKLWRRGGAQRGAHCHRSRSPPTDFAVVKPR